MKQAWSVDMAGLSDDALFRERQAAGCRAESVLSLRDLEHLKLNDFPQLRHTCSSSLRLITPSTSTLIPDSIACFKAIKMALESLGNLLSSIHGRPFH